MASARELVLPIIAGLASAVGGPQVAQGVHSAAAISRQGRMDKQREEDRILANAQTARRLQLAEEAAERDIGRDKRYAERADFELEEARKRTKEQEASRARTAVAIDDFISANPEVATNPSYSSMLSLARTEASPDQALRLIQDIGKRLGIPTGVEAQAMAEQLGLKPGQSFQIDTADGGSFRASGLEPEGKGDKRDPSQLFQVTMNDAGMKFDEPIAKAETEVREAQAAIAATSGIPGSEDHEAARKTKRDAEIRLESLKRQKLAAQQSALYKAGFDLNDVNKALGITTSSDAQAEGSAPAASDEDEIVTAAFDANYSPTAAPTATPVPTRVPPRMGAATTTRGLYQQAAPTPTPLPRPR